MRSFKSPMATSFVINYNFLLPAASFYHSPDYTTWLRFHIGIYNGVKYIFLNIRKTEFLGFLYKAELEKVIPIRPQRTWNIITQLYG